VAAPETIRAILGKRLPVKNLNKTAAASCGLILSDLWIFIGFMISTGREALNAID
jgi:hypothetical protein